MRAARAARLFFYRSTYQILNLLLLICDVVIPVGMDTRAPCWLDDVQKGKTHVQSVELFLTLLSSSLQWLL